MIVSSRKVVIWRFVQRKGERESLGARMTSVQSFGAAERENCRRHSTRLSLHCPFHVISALINRAKVARILRLAARARDIRTTGIG